MLTLQGISIGIIVLISIISRFFYTFCLGENEIWFKDDNLFFGYNRLSSFLYSFGMEMSQVSFGFVLWICSNFNSKENKSRIYFKYISVSLILVGFFFMSWIFTDALYFSKAIEIVLAIVFSVLATLISIIFMLVLSRDIRNIKELKYSVIDFSFKIRNKHYLPMLKEAMRANLDDQITQREIKKKSEQFDKEIYEKTKNLID